MVDGELSGTILNEQIGFLAKDRRGLSQYVECGSLVDVMKRLADRAEAEDRVILFFSSHEPRVFVRCLPGDLLQRLAPLLVDGRPLMKQMAARGRRRDEDGKVTLHSLAMALVPGVAREQAGVRVGHTIRRLLNAAGRTQRVYSVPKGAFQAWLDLLDYNRQDLRMLWKGVLRALKKRDWRGALSCTPVS